MKIFHGRLRRVTAVILLAALLGCLIGCSGSPAAGSTELLGCTQSYFMQLRLLNPGFQKGVLDEFRRVSEELDRCVRTHEDYFADYPDARAAYALMVQLPEVFEQNLEPSADGTYELRQLPYGWYSCLTDLWGYVYPGVYGAVYSDGKQDDAALLKWLADDSFSDGESPCHWWLDGYLAGSRCKVQWPETVEWQKD